MKLSYFFGVMLGVVFVLGLASRVQAAWPLNTPDRQWDPKWAGQNLIWNDDRLGSADLFWQKENGVVEPLLVLPGDQRLLATSSSKGVIATHDLSSDHLDLFDLTTATIQPVSVGSEVKMAATDGRSVAWFDGTTIYWWKDGTTRSILGQPTKLILGPLGLAWVEGDMTKIWIGDNQTSLPCPRCLTVDWVSNHLAYQNESGQISFWPDDLSPIAAAPRSFTTNSQSLVFWSAGQTFIWRNNQTWATDPIPPGAIIGSAGYAMAAGGDITSYLDPPPQLTETEHQANLASLIFGGTATANLIHLVVTKDQTVTHLTIPVHQGRWHIESILPLGAADGSYTVTAQAESRFGQLSQIYALGSVVYDRTPPVISPIEVTPSLDVVKLHWHTDEKTQSVILLDPESAEDGSVSRKYQSLTFSHTASVSGLSPGRMYHLQIWAIDTAGNTSQVATTFTTLALTAVTTKDVTDFLPGVKGVWEGILLAEPGVVGADQAIINAGIPILIDWTIGRPPPELQRGQRVRIYGTVNQAGTKLLAHRSSAIIALDETAMIEVHPIHHFSDLEGKNYIWIVASGVVSHATKTGGELELSDGSLKLVWSDLMNNRPKRNESVTVIGFWYPDGDSFKLAVTSLLAEKEAPTSTIVLAKADQPVSKLADALPPNSISSATTIIEEAAVIRDKVNQTWYYEALIVMGVLSYVIFFFLRR